jgi:hypothetical protein
LIKKAWKKAWTPIEKKKAWTPIEKRKGLEKAWTPIVQE